MTTESIYWITRLDAFKSIVSGAGTFCSIVLVLSFTGLIFGLIFGKALKCFNSRFGKDDCDYIVGSTIFSISRVVFILSLVFNIIFSAGEAFIPSTKEYFVIKTLPVICSKASISKMSDLMPEALDAASDWVKSLKNAK